jgi:hypothetical protein
VTAAFRAAALAGDRERARGRDDLERVRIDSRQLGDDDDLVVGPVAVDVRPQGTPQPP